MKKLKLNTISSLVLQVVTILCGMILPRLLIQRYGSEINGLVTSITQFLGIISFMDLGISRTVQSALYKPLVERDNRKISEIVTSADTFFRRLARGFLLYVIILVVAYPYLVNQSFGFAYTAALVSAMSISTFAQYYFGVVNGLLLTADQKGYISYITQTITVALNTVSCILLIYLGASIQVVRLMTSLIFLIRPLVLMTYVKKHYALNRGISYESEPIQQKWDGLAQHVAMVVFESTDSIVLSVFSSLSNASIYSVYNMVVHGLKMVISSMTHGALALMGELWARQEKKRLTEFFEWTEWLIHTGSVFVFGCAGCLLIPFVMVYTNDIADINYSQPLFSALITLASAGYCLRLPYNMMILAAGHYRQTMKSFIITAVLNVVISVLAVWKFGLVGVVCGTLVAILYQLFYMVRYDITVFGCTNGRHFFIQLLADLATVGIGALLSLFFEISELSYRAWIVLAFQVAAVWFVTILAVNGIMYPDRVEKIAALAKKKIFGKR